MKLRNRLVEPLIVDRSINLLCATVWLLYGLWGIFYTFSAGQNLISDHSSEAYAVVWGASIGLSALVACVSAFFIIFPHSKKIKHIATHFELSAVVYMAVFVTAYPGFQVLRLASGDLSPLTIATTILSFSYLALPIWRIYDLAHRVKE